MRTTLLIALCSLSFVACLSGDNPMDCAEAHDSGVAYVEGWIEGRNALACEVDSDCTVVHLQNQCQSTCAVPVAAALADTLVVAASLDAAQRCDRCAAPEEQSCGEVIVSCQEGQCVEGSARVPDVPLPPIPGDEPIGRDDEPGDDEPGDDEPGDDEPGDDEPGDDEPGDDEPGDDEPGDDGPGDDEPGDDEPDEEDPFDINASVIVHYCGSSDVLSYDGDPSGGACENEQDITALLHGECVDVWQVISEQGIAAGCLSVPGFMVECVAAALQDHKELTDGCAGCFGQHVACIADSCVTDCVPDEGSDACLCCQLEKGCYGPDGFDGCAGLDFVVSPEIFETCAGL